MQSMKFIQGKKELHFHLTFPFIPKEILYNITYRAVLNFFWPPASQAGKVESYQPEKKIKGELSL